MILETRDVLQSNTTLAGDTLAIEFIAPNGIAVWLNHHRADFTASEALAFSKALRELARFGK